MGEARIAIGGGIIWASYRLRVYQGRKEEKSDCINSIIFLHRGGLRIGNKFPVSEGMEGEGLSYIPKRETREREASRRSNAGSGICNEETNVETREKRRCEGFPTCCAKGERARRNGIVRELL